MVAEDIINRSKRVETGEIIVTLFEQCNLACAFCTQDHASVVGIDTIPNKIEEIKHSIDDLTPKGKTKFSVNIMGGEVFDDRLDDSVFDEYKKLISAIRVVEQEKSVPILISFVTNCIWSSTKRIKQFLDDTQVRMVTSYDPVGRFNPQTFDVFQQRVIEFTSYIDSVNVIMTKPAVASFVEDRTPFFAYLYKHFDIYLDYYTPEHNFVQFMPTDVELRQFMVYMFEHYPDCYPMNTFTQRTKTRMSCMDTYTVLPTGQYGRCEILTSGIKALPITFVPKKKDMEQEWLDHYNCIECIHFQRCTMGCFLSHHIKDTRTQKECWLSQVYDYVDNRGL